MANTLKFGNGEWYGKKDAILAYNDENNNYKPLPFDFSRGSTATVVNKDGLIETVGSGEPRIDYKDNTKGALLLEPSRMNSLLQSNQFDTTWIIGASALDLTSGQSGVYGSNDAWLLKKNATGSRYIQQSLSLSSAQYSYSIYLKAESTNWVYLQSSDGSSEVTSYFDLENGVVGTTAGSNLDSATIDNAGNGWYRCTLTYTQATSYVRIYPADSNGSISPTNDNGIYIQYAQLEQGSYPTSYIPTQGVVTRLADSCSQTPPDGVIGQTEGTMFLEYPNIDDLFAFIGLSINGGNSNRMVIYSIGDNTLKAQFRQGGAITLSGISSIINGKVKAALSFSSTESVFYVNGIQVAVGTAIAFTGLNQVSLNQANQIGGKIKELKIYNTRLSNSELQALTQV